MSATDLGTTVLRTPEETWAWGRALAAELRAGDVVLLTGDLGAGKTTLTRGLGEGLGVRGEVTSPTFVIARVHPSLTSGPALVHVDAYRLHGGLELDDLDLDASIEDSVTVVEWGHDLAERLAESYLEVELARVEAAPGVAGAGIMAPDDDTPAEPRQVHLTGHGPRWVATDAARPG